MNLIGVVFLFAGLGVMCRLLRIVDWSWAKIAVVSVVSAVVIKALAWGTVHLSLM
jgi:hypothetical protein